MAFCSAYHHYLIALSFCVLYAHASSSQADHTNDITKWAVLVAGSNGWDDYRFQADICRAYQLLKAGGLKDEPIIVFMYDDIADNSENEEPYKGEIYSEGMSGIIKEVYTGVPKDYTGNQVTRTNLYKVLLGEKPWPGAKVLNTRPNDLVFIYYSGHGVQNFLDMPLDQYIGRKKHICQKMKLVGVGKFGTIFEDSFVYRTTSYISIIAWSIATSTHLYEYNTNYKAYLSNVYNIGTWMNEMGKYAPIHPGKRPINDQYLTDRHTLTKTEEKKSNTIRKWAVLVAGSTGLGDYRHQADICRAYQILKAGGLKDEHIIIFMYDDIANHANGTVYNIGISGERKDVYAGVPKDYTGDNVTWNNLSNVLLGVKRWPSSKVLTTGPKDHVFIYFSGHGYENFLVMPDMHIHRDDFLDVLWTMHDNKPLNQLVVYIQACNSGSMFEGPTAKWLDHTNNIFITTSSNSSHSCHAHFYDTKLKTYLSNLYGATWMNDTEYTLIHPRWRTLNAQYLMVKDRLASAGSSNVMRFGSTLLGKKDIGEFFRDVPPQEKIIAN